MFLPHLRRQLCWQRGKIDENLPQEISELLKVAGHDALTVRQQGLAGKGDDQLASICRAEGRALVTLDLDFSNIRAYPPAEHPGIIVLRLDRQDKQTVLKIMEGILPLLLLEPLKEKLWIVEPDRVRIRGQEEGLGQP
ncbi:MAG: DUF5615 family PIN-like protein [Spirochaetales bacterium]|nr:DUF5615 family PIN-like protein [Spirochaetales bacterium]